MLCGLVGGPGLVSGGNFNDTNGMAVFEQATRNAGRKIAGKNMANPTAYLVATSKVFPAFGIIVKTNVNTRPAESPFGLTIEFIRSQGITLNRTVITHMERMHIFEHTGCNELVGRGGFFGN